MESFLNIPADSHFSIHNLPYGVFSRSGAPPRVGVAVGEHVLDLHALHDAGAFGEIDLGEGAPFAQPSLNAFMALGKTAWSAVRERLQDLLSADGSTELRDDDALRDRALLAMDDVTLHLPVEVGDYTDFYSSKQHATNVGTMFRGPENALKENWLHLPVGYHGRASSVVLSDTPVRRPKGQLKPADGPPTFGPSDRLDFELELGVLVGTGNDLGDSISVDEAGDHIFGYVLVNDWSARDIQKWEYVPLGPFLGKSFATSISPWVVPAEALAAVRVEGEPQRGDNPEPLPYLKQSEPRCLDIRLEARLETAAMREAGEAPALITETNAMNLYWSPEQQLAHHTVNGCNARPGDLLASGTISGTEPGSYGSLLELSWNGENPLPLPDGSERTFLEDGDRLILTGVAETPEGHRVGFGEVSGTIEPATD